MDLENCPSVDCDFIYVKPNINDKDIANLNSFQRMRVNDIDDPKNFKCPRCEKNICLLCNSSVHLGKTCEEAKNELFEEKDVNELFAKE
jgi:hypothetical protein